MAVKIRLKRMGKTHAPKYRIVVVDSRVKRDGEVIEEIGTYRPQEEPSHIHVVSERVQYWLGVGAQPSKTVSGLLELTGDWQTFKGLPGAEGRLKPEQQPKDKQAIFNEALKEVHHDTQGEAVTGKSEKSGKADQSGKPGKTDRSARADAADQGVEVKPEEESATEVESDGDKPGAEAAPGEIPTPADESPSVAAAQAEDEAVEDLRSDDAKTDS